MSICRLVQKRMPTRSTRLVSDREAGAGVAKHLDAATRERRGHVVIVVVIAEDAEDAERSGQRRERFRGGLDEIAIAPRDVVAAEHDEFRPLGHEQRDRGGRRRRARPSGCGGRR